MKIRKFASVALLAAASWSAQAGVVLSEGFDDVGGLSGAGWSFASNGNGGGDGWFQGNTGIFSAPSGPANSYAAANWVGTASSISDWIITPELSVANGGTLSFSLRLLGEGYLDTVEVYGSNAGASTNLADFSLLTSFSSASDTGWTSESLSLAAFSGRLAFRYVVADTNSDGNYVGLDSVKVEAVPEPASLALVALALTGLAATRRRRA